MYEAGMLEAARIPCGWAEEREVVEDEMQAEGQLTDLVVQLNAQVLF